MKQASVEASHGGAELKATTGCVEEVDEKQMSKATAGKDYAGAAAKTDPVEIKLVRKLDLRIMVW